MKGKSYFCKITACVFTRSTFIEFVSLRSSSLTIPRLGIASLPPLCPRPRTLPARHHQPIEPPKRNTTCKFSNSPTLTLWQRLTAILGTSLLRPSLRALRSAPTLPSRVAPSRRLPPQSVLRPYAPRNLGSVRAALFEVPARKTAAAVLFCLFSWNLLPTTAASSTVLRIYLRVASRPPRLPHHHHRRDQHHHH